MSIEQDGQGFGHATTEPRSGVDRRAPALGGARFNAGKTRLDLIPGPGALSEVANVATFGLHKYDAHNWRKGLSWSDCFRAILSHSFKFFTGEDRDPESGCLHVAHTAWNALALTEMMLSGQRYLSFDDRPREIAPIQGTENVKEPPRKLSDSAENAKKHVSTVSFDSFDPTCPKCVDPNFKMMHECVLKPKGPILDKIERTM